MVIWKQSMNLSGRNVVRMPVGAQIVSAREQADIPTIWFLCDPDSPALEDRYFFVVGTGHKLPQEYKAYIGTCHLYDGKIVVHIFEDAV